MRKSQEKVFKKILSCKWSNTQDKKKSSSEAVLKTSGKDHFVPSLEGQNGREQNCSTPTSAG